MGAGSQFQIKTATEENLYLECEVKNSKVEIRINGRAAGEVEASGSAQGKFTSGLGTYGAMPGENLLELIFSEVGPAPTTTCNFLDKKDFSDKKPKVLRSIQPVNSDFAAKKYATRFVLESKGYYASLEPSFVKLAHMAKERYKDDEMVGQFMRSVRKNVMRAPSEQEAKKLLDDLLSK